MKKNIALVTGGFSGEAVISYKSAATIYDNLDRDRFNVYLIDINPDGWWYKGADGTVSAVDKNDFSILAQGQKIVFDAVFLSMHGTPGEDGKLQGYFDTLRIPYTGCDASTSAITFNKRYAKAVAAMSGLRTAKSILLYKESIWDKDFIVNNLTFPVFVKPNNGGSSIGMSKVGTPLLLDSAIEKAFREDVQVLIEEMVQGREFTVGVFRSRDTVTVLPITEVKVHDDKEFFDFEAKYQGKSSETTPAVIDEVVAEKLRQAARKVYEIFNCRGAVRIDFIYHEQEQTPYMLEVNTIPGQSEASIIPQQVKVMGWSLKEFYSQLIDEVLL